MRFFVICRRCAVSVVLAVMLSGCSGGPARVRAPHVDPRSAATQAMELYDTNHDEKLSQEELAKCPGVLVSMDRYDTNRDKVIDLEEFAGHVAELLRNG